MYPKFKRYRNPSQLPQADLPEHAMKFSEPGNFFQLTVASLLVLGLLPLLWLIVPAEVTWLSRFLFAFATFGLLYGAGDYVNAFNAAVQIPKNAATCMSGFHSYWRTGTSLRLPETKAPGEVTLGYN